jgi:lysophospholipase L1-like esterase
MRGQAHARTRVSTPVAVLVSIACFLLLLLAAEGAGRLYMHARYGVPGKRYGRWRADPVLGARMGENRYDHRWQTDDGGFRNDQNVIEPRREGAWRIIAYGGSTTLCWNLPTASTWPSRLEHRLRAATGDSAQQVLNAGDILWSIGHILARAKAELPRLHPDFVILYTGVNEEANADLLAASGRSLRERMASGEYGAFARNLPQDSWLARNSILYKAAQKVIGLPAARLWREMRGEKWSRLRQTPIDAAHPASPPDPDVLRNYLHVLDELIQVCDENGARPVFVIEATGLRTVGLARMTAYSREGARVASERGVPVVDAQAMVDAYPGDRMELFRDSGIHYSKKGADLLAAKIFDEVFRPLVEPPVETGAPVPR